MKKSSLHHGFSLIEMLVYIGILALVITTSASALYSFSETIAVYKREVEIEKYGNFILQKAHYQLIHNQAIVLPNTHPEFTITHQTVTTKPLQSDMQEITVSFSIDNHNFFISHINIHE
jgi:type II secretory pathway pseudopilin PulG